MIKYAIITTALLTYTLTYMWGVNDIPMLVTEVKLIEPISEVEITHLLKTTVLDERIITDTEFNAISTNPEIKVRIPYDFMLISGIPWAVFSLSMLAFWDSNPNLNTLLNRNIDYCLKIAVIATQLSSPCKQITTYVVIPDDVALSEAEVDYVNVPDFSEVAKVYEVTRLAPFGMFTPKNGILGMAALANAGYLSGHSWPNPDSTLQSTTAFGLAVFPIFLWTAVTPFNKLL